MKNNASFIVGNDRNQAELIVDALKTLGFTSTDISVSTPDKPGAFEIAQKPTSKMPGGTTTRLVAGMGTGAILGWLVGIDTLAIPGAGMVIAVGPAVAAASGAAVGGATAGLFSAVIGNGSAQPEFKHPDPIGCGGKTQISVHTDDFIEEQTVKEVYEQFGAEGIKWTCETNAPN